MSRLSSCIVLGVAWIGASAGCSGSSVGAPASLGFTAQQRQIADQIVSVFENDSPVIQYGYAEDIGDGRGITAGRAGFTSATGDLLLVVQRYTDAVPKNNLAKYIPRLEQLATDESDDTTDLVGLVEAWGAAADDPVFRGVQDAVVDEEYFTPALQHAEHLGLTLPLSLLNLYDTAIQHGDGEDPDGLPAIIATATSQAGGTPAGGVDEQTWLRAFIAARRAVLLHASAPDTRAAWAESTGRVDALLQLLDAGNVNLTPPLTIAPFGATHTLPI